MTDGQWRMLARGLKLLEYYTLQRTNNYQTIVPTSATEPSLFRLQFQVL
jgi:hypothetical protein